MKKVQKFCLTMMLALLFSGCIKKPLPLMEKPISSIRQNVLTQTITPTPTPTFTTVPSETPTVTETGTVTSTPMPTSRYSIPRAEVIPDKLNCRYGPGAAYLYKFGLSAGNVLEVIGRSPYNNWVLLRAIGGNNPCWASGSNFEYDGDLSDVDYVDYHFTFPDSPYAYYWSPLKNVSATRDGDDVTIHWGELVLYPGDESYQFLYLVEAWVCQDKNYVFLPIGSYKTAIKVTDQKGCDTPSVALVYWVEKHGYTPVFELPLPLHIESDTATPVINNTLTPTSTFTPVPNSSLTQTLTATNTETPTITGTPP